MKRISTLLFLGLSLSALHARACWVDQESIDDIVKSLTSSAHITGYDELYFKKRITPGPKISYHEALSKLARVAVLFSQVASHSSITQNQSIKK